MSVSMDKHACDQLAATVAYAAQAQAQHERRNRLAVKLSDDMVLVSRLELQRLVAQALKAALAEHPAK